MDGWTVHARSLQLVLKRKAAFNPPTLCGEAGGLQAHWVTEVSLWESPVLLVTSFPDTTGEQPQLGVLFSSLSGL